MKKLFVVGILIFTVLIGCSTEAKPKEQPSKPSTSSVGYDSEFRTMDEAVAEARRTFPEFVNAFETSAWGEGDYIVRMTFFDPKRQIGEDLFITFEKLSDDQITGVIESDPQFFPDLKRGTRVTKPIRELRDWMFVPTDGDHRGGYTLRTLPDEGENKTAE